MAVFQFLVSTEQSHTLVGHVGLSPIFISCDTYKVTPRHRLIFVVQSGLNGCMRTL